MIPKKVTMTRAEKPKVFHRDFLGAHRYTTRGGTARPAGGVLRTTVVCRGQPRGDTKSMIVEPDKKINPKAWTKELDGLKERYHKTEKPLSDATLDLAKMEVLNHNKRDLERMLENESHKRMVSRDRNITL